MAGLTMPALCVMTDCQRPVAPDSRICCAICQAEVDRREREWLQRAGLDCPVNPVGQADLFAGDEREED